MPCYVLGCHEVARRRVNHPRFGRVGSCSAHDPDPNRHLSTFGLRLPELHSDPNTVVLVGPVGIDEAIAVWGGVEAGGEWVLDWLKHEGDTVRAGELLAELRGHGCPETLPSPVDGVLKEIVAKQGVVPPRSVVAFVQAAASGLPA